jgi:hypothetical protein
VDFVYFAYGFWIVYIGFHDAKTVCGRVMRGRRRKREEERRKKARE